MKKKAKKLKPMSPHEARSLNDTCALQTDNYSTKGGWILLNDGEVVLCQQKPGENSVGSVHFTRAEFKRMADWYLKPQPRVQRS